MRFPEHIRPYVRFNEPMSAHTTFKTGGPADIYIAPPCESFVVIAKECIQTAREHGAPLFILGGGANLCVSDGGIRGIVLDTSGFRGVREAGGGIEANAGEPACGLARFACARGRGGLEFLAGLPGSVGGAAYMNARCFERAVSDALIHVDFLDEALEERRLYTREGGWDYKKSPFQGRAALILSAAFRVEPADPRILRARYDGYVREREEKGHFRCPSAGSVFKNNRAFGAPAGALIERLGLCGLREGGAQIAPWHGNFIVNSGGAHSADIRALVERVKTEARERLGLGLEEEIIFAGDWCTRNMP